MKASDLFIKALEAEGVEYIFGVPGEENLDLLDSISRSHIKLILTRHEQAAGFMAATYGRLTGKAGVCMSTLGPGATNLVTAAAYAQLGGMPVLMITGQKPIKASKQGQFQIVNIVEMMMPLTKYTRQIVSSKNIPSSIREAVRLAEEEKPGTVHLELPEDVAIEETDVEIIEKSKVRRPVADEKAITSAKDLLEKSVSPLILIGAGSNRKLTGKMLKKLIEKLQIPFFSSQMGKGVVDERNPLFLGNAALSDNDFLHYAINKSDLIINVGHDVIEKPPFFMEHGGKKVIHINFSSAAVDSVYFPQVEVVGDIANSLWQLTERSEKMEHWDFEYFFKVKELIEEDIREGSEDKRFPVLPQRLVYDVRNVMPEDGIITLDNGVYKIWFARNYKAYKPNTILLDNALATMGAGLPSAIAAKLVYPDRKVMAVTGDGGFMMNSQEIETAVRLKLDIVVLILKDNAYGMIKWKQENLGLPDFGLDFGNPDFVKYAESYGAKGHRANSLEDLGVILSKCHSSKGVHIVEIEVDYSENNKILNKMLVGKCSNL